MDLYLLDHAQHQINQMTLGSRVGRKGPRHNPFSIYWGAVALVTSVSQLPFHNHSPCQYNDLSEAEAPFYYSVHWGKPGHAVLSTQFINTIYSRSIPLSGLTQCPETRHWERRRLLKRKKCQFQPSPLKWNKRNKVNKEGEVNTISLGWLRLSSPIQASMKPIKTVLSS